MIGRMTDRDDHHDSESDAGTEPAPRDEQLGSFLTALAASMARGALQVAARTSEAPLKLARTVLSEGGAQNLKPDNLQAMYDAGQYLRDLREVAGLTARDLAAALDLRDPSLIEAAESGRAALPFETILRLSALVARRDPLPFVIRMMRSYNPEAWQVLQEWGIGRLPLQLERERRFINIYRGNDNARRLSDESFTQVLEFTRAAFEMALQFAEEFASESDSAQDDAAGHSPSTS